MKQVRRARADEAGDLSDLARRSKGHWGYDAAFLEACRDELTLTEEYIKSSPVYVLDDDGSIVGFYGLRGRPPDGEVAFLFVEPNRIGSGAGRILWDHMIETARDGKYELLTIDSDPGAESFYVAMGATRVGTVPSGSIPGRNLPLLHYRLDR